MFKEDIVYSYTRSDAITDGVLVDVTDYTPEGEHLTLARQAGFKVPIALTRAVYHACVALPEGYQGIQDVTGRLWDLLICMRQTILAHSKASGVRFTVSVRSIDNENNSETQHDYRLTAVIGPGDDGEPVITVMFPNED